MAVRARPVTWFLLGVVVLWGLALVAERQGYIQPLEGVAQEALNPVQGATIAILRPAQEFLTGLTRYGELARENQSLRHQVMLLQTENARLQEYAYENQQLRRDLQFKNRQPDLELVRARIISEDSSNYVNALLIDQGRSAGIVPGMIAVSGAGLVGRVESVTNGTAKVLLSIDPSTSIYAVVQREGERISGVVEGTGEDRLRLKYVSQNADLRSGDAVVTSGRGGAYPGGIQIGEISIVQRNDVAPFQEADVRPAVDARHLETLLVVVNFLPATTEE